LCGDVYVCKNYRDLYVKLIFPIYRRSLVK